MEQFTGTIKSFNHSKGWGFIECPETFELYGKDVFVLGSALPKGQEAAKGDKVTFDVVQGDNGNQASNISLVNGGGARMLPKSFQGGGGGVVGGGSRAPPSRASDGAPRGAYGGGKGQGGGGCGAAAQFIGVVKSWNEAKGWGFVTSDVVMQLYGKDILFRRTSCPMGVAQVGQQVSFAVVEGNNGPLAENVQPFGALVGFPGAPPPPPSFFGAAPPSMMPAMTGGKGGRVPPPPAGQPTRSYFGCVRAYNEEKGWGHIDCPAAHEAFGKDVFLLRSAVVGQDVEAKSLVSFMVVMSAKGPQASEVTVLPPGAFSFGGNPGNVYQGVVKSFREEKGWGFATSDDIQRLFGKDIFLHKRELGDLVPSAGDGISFSVEQGPTGNLEAKQVQLQGGDGLDDLRGDGLDDLRGDGLDDGFGDSPFGPAPTVIGKPPRPAPY